MGLRGLAPPPPFPTPQGHLGPNLLIMSHHISLVFQYREKKLRIWETLTLSMSADNSISKSYIVM